MRIKKKWIIIAIVLLILLLNVDIAGRLLNMAVDDMRAKGITPLYLVTDHTGFYERYGWEFFCMVQGDGEEEMSRMYIHK